MILGTNMSNARLELPIGTEPRASNLSTAPLCSSYNTQSRYYDDPRIDGDEIPGVAEHVRRGGPTQRCTTVAGLTVDERGQPGGSLWKLLTGDVQQNYYTGPVADSFDYVCPSNFADVFSGVAFSIPRRYFSLATCRVISCSPPPFRQAALPELHHRHHTG